MFMQKIIYFRLKTLRSTDLKTILKMIRGEKDRERGGGIKIFKKWSTPVLPVQYPRIGRIFSSVL